MSKKSKEGYIEAEEELLLSKIEDKIKFTKTKNKITYTDFLNMQERGIVEKFLRIEKINNYFCYGGNENAERVIFVFYPEKINEEMAKKNLENILSVIKIENSKEEDYEHRVYLSAVMKLGLKREKIGDIIVSETGAEIVVFEENIDYLINGLKQLIRFRKSDFSILNISELSNKELKFEEFTIIVSSIRLDCFVAELAKCSRTKAEEYIEFGKVFINSLQELKSAKKLQIGDIITIRGKGKFIFQNIVKETSKNRFVIQIQKYI